MKKWRSIREAVADIKADDPHSAISEWHLRQLIINDIIPYARVGRKYLLSLEDLDEYLNGYRGGGGVG